jgi:hypothetical protein
MNPAAGEDISGDRSTVGEGGGVSHARPWIDTGSCRSAAWVLGIGLAVLLWRSICTTPGIEWNTVRLATPFALAEGLPIYALRDSALQLGWCYGPVFPAWYLPITLTSNPTVALMLGAVINAFTILGAVAVVLRVAGVRRLRSILLGIVIYGVFLCSVESTRQVFYFIHVDNVCLACGWLGCSALFVAVRRENRRVLHLAALAVVLAIWTKQIAVMLVPGMLLWLWREGYRRWLWSFCFLTFLYGAVATIAITARFGAAEVLFNLCVVHAHNPWQGGWSFVVGELGRLFASAWPCWAVVVWSLASRRAVATEPITERPWSFFRLLGWTAATQLPLGLIAVAKAGGGLNSVHSFNYIFVAGLLLLLSAISQPMVVSPGWRISLLWGIAMVLPLGNAFVFAARAGMAWTPFREQEQFVAMARREPGRFYFPWSPLATLMAERRIYPTDDALYCLWHIGLEVQPERIRAALPAHPVILYQEPAQSHFALRYFPTIAHPATPTPPK